MLVEVEVVGGEGAEVAVHSEVEGRVVPFNGLEEVADCDFRIELLADFADQGSFW